MVATAAFAASADSALAYELDPGFGNSGLVLTDGPGGGSDSLNDLVALPGGKVLAAGFMSTVSGGRDFAVARYDDDGSLDQSFGGGDGIVTTNIGGAAVTDDLAQAMAVQDDGRIVLAGTSRGTGLSDNDDEVVVARYEADGTLDTDSDSDGGFGDGDDGSIVIPISATEDDRADGLAIDATGRIVTVGSTYLGPTLGVDFALVRLTPDGLLDGSFDGASAGNGILTIDFTSSSGDDGWDAGLAAGLFDDGDILAAGFAEAADGDPDGYAMARLNAADGTLDPSFDGPDGDGDGKFVRGNESEIVRVAVSPGKILAVGDSPGAGWSLERYDQSDGDLDTTFGGGDGVVNTEVGGAINARARDVAIDGGTYVVAGDVAFDDNDQGVGVGRYFGAGNLDTDFGGDGLIALNFQPPTGSESGDAVAVIDDANALTDNKVVVGGESYEEDFTQRNWTLYRFRPDSSAPPSLIAKPDQGKSYRASRIRTFTGTASDPNEGSGVDEVEVALRRKRTNGTCAWWDGDSFAGGDCSTRVFVDATGATSWSYTLPSDLKSSTGTKIKDYTLYSRADDLAGNAEASFDKGRNANRFDVR